MSLLLMTLCQHALQECKSAIKSSEDSRRKQPSPLMRESKKPSISVTRQTQSQKQKLYTLETSTHLNCEYK